MYAYLWSMAVYGTFDTEEAARAHAIDQGAYLADVYVYRYSDVNATRLSRTRTETVPAGSFAAFRALGQ